MARRVVTIFLLLAFLLPQFRGESDPCVSTSPDGCTDAHEHEHGEDDDDGGEPTLENGSDPDRPPNTTTCRCPCHSQMITWRPEPWAPNAPQAEGVALYRFQTSGAHVDRPYRPPRTV